MKFHTAVIIYNPNSTGDSQKNARLFADELQAAGFDGSIELLGTKFAGHAEEMAAKYAADENVIIVSSSGDGGYNEVINGILQNRGRTVTAVLPSGNANDHHRAVAPADMVRSIIGGQTKRIEVIHIRSSSEGKPWDRYAHSYIGFGMTARIGRVLTDARPNAFSEKWYVLTHLFSSKFVKLELDDVVRQYDNLIAATVNRMSKVLRLDEAANMQDGKMEIYITNHLSPIGRLKSLFRAGTTGISPVKQTNCLQLKSINKTAVQLDGEVFDIDAASTIELTCLKDGLTTLS